MKTTLISFYETEPLEIKHKNASFDNRNSERTINNNLRVGAEIFKWLYSTVPSNVWDGFAEEAQKHNIEIREVNLG